MNRKQLFAHILTFSTASIGAYMVGVYTERQKFDKTNIFLQQKINFNDDESSCSYVKTSYEKSYLNEFKRLPALPIFGTVSAAVPVPVEEVNLTATPARISQIMKYGFPCLDNVRSYSDFVLSYDRRNRIPNWVFEHLTPQSIAKNEAVDRARCEFKSDESIHPYFRSQNSDYRRSGFDRGHMAAAGNHRLHQKHCDDTFYLTNMAPQVGQGFNRDSWNRLEMYVRKLTNTYPNLYVCTGPLYLPKKETDGKMYIKYQVIGTNQVAVPTHFYKVVVGEKPDQSLEMEAYVMPNQVISDDTPLQVFQVPPETIERAAGLLFFDKMNKKQLTRVNGKKV